MIGNIFSLIDDIITDFRLLIFIIDQPKLQIIFHKNKEFKPIDAGTMVT